MDTALEEGQARRDITVAGLSRERIHHCRATRKAAVHRPFGHFKTRAVEWFQKQLQAWLWCGLSGGGRGKANGSNTVSLTDRHRQLILQAVGQRM